MNTQIFNKLKAGFKSFCFYIKRPKWIPFPGKPRLKCSLLCILLARTSYKLLFPIFTSTSFVFISRRIPFVQFDGLYNNCGSTRLQSIWPVLHEGNPIEPFEDFKNTLWPYGPSATQKGTPNHMLKSVTQLL